MAVTATSFYCVRVLKKRDNGDKTGGRMFVTWYIESTSREIETPKAKKETKKILVSVKLLSRRTRMPNSERNSRRLTLRGDNTRQKPRNYWSKKKCIISSLLSAGRVALFEQLVVGASWIRKRVTGSYNRATDSQICCNPSYNPSNLQATKHTHTHTHTLPQLSIHHLYKIISPIVRSSLDLRHY